LFLICIRKIYWLKKYKRRWGICLVEREFLILAGMSLAANMAGYSVLSAENYKKEDKKMVYTAKDYSKLLGISGFSDALLKNHFTLYQGYVNNTNKLLEILSNLQKEGKYNTPEYAELKRRLGWE